MYCQKCGHKVSVDETAQELGGAFGISYGFVGGAGAGALVGSKAIVDSMAAASTMTVGAFAGGVAAIFTLPLITGAAGAGALYLYLKHLGKRIDKIKGKAECKNCGSLYVVGYNKRRKKTLMVPARPK